MYCIEYANLLSSLTLRDYGLLVALLLLGVNLGYMVGRKQYPPDIRQ